jgi:arsenite-transporting ATPase
MARQLDAQRELQGFRDAYRDRLSDVLEGLGLRESLPLDRDVLESLIAMAPPGIDEVFALDAMLQETEGRQVLVVDAAPTGHLVRLLEMPQIAKSWTHALLRVLLKYRSVVSLEDFASHLLGFARRLDGLMDLLRDPDRCGAVVVTLDEPIPLLETRRLVETLGEMEVPVAAVVHNRSGGSIGNPVGQASAAVEVLAPWVRPAPIGVESLSEFLDRWITA